MTIETKTVDRFATSREHAAKKRETGKQKENRAENRKAVGEAVRQNSREVLQVLSSATTGKLIGATDAYSMLPNAIMDVLQVSFFDPESKRTDEEQLVGFIISEINQIGGSLAFQWTTEPDKYDREQGKEELRERYQIGERLATGSASITVERSRLAQQLLG